MRGGTVSILLFFTGVQYQFCLQLFCITNQLITSQLDNVSLCYNTPVGHLPIAIKFQNVPGEISCHSQYLWRLIRRSALLRVRKQPETVKPWCT